MRRPVTARLVEVRKEDGAQCWRHGPDVTDVIWLCGVDRVAGAEVGHEATLIYVHTATRGSYRLAPGTGLKS